MNPKNFALCAIAPFVALAPMTAQAQQSPPAAKPKAEEAPAPKDAVGMLRAEGLERSQVMDHLSTICDVHGPRLTGSPALRRAQKWAQETFESWGLHGARMEPWGPFGNGWQFDHVSLSVVGETSWPVIGYPKAWSPSIEKVEAEVVYVGEMKAEELETMDLSGKIVLIEPPRPTSEWFEGTADRYDNEELWSLATGAPLKRDETAAPPSFRSGFRRRGAIQRMVFPKKPLAVLDRSYKGDYGTLFVTSASIPAPDNVARGARPRPWNPGDHHVVPQFTVAVEHYNRICRLLKKGQPVRMAVELKTQTFTDDPMEYNVVADLPGSDLADEVVMIGAHFDSWHTGTGASDNGCGSAVMMEAMRLLKHLADQGHPPRRTIRIGLWSGEEQGLIGSRAYVAEHFGTKDEPKPAHGKLAGYFNMDNGTGRVRGVYLQGNEAVGPFFRDCLKPFHDLDAATITPDNTGGTDHLAFDRVGLPGFQFIQDPVAYSTRTHHSNMDNWDHAVSDDLQQAATIIASFAWHTAQRDEMLPRKQ